MTECPLEHHTDVPLLEEASVRDRTSRHAQLSVSGNGALNRLLVLLPSYLQSLPTSRASLFPPRLLLSICDVLQHGRLDSATEQSDTSVLASVLSKLRDWRLLDLGYRLSTEGIHRLAVDLAGITCEHSTPPNPVLNQTSRDRLRVKYVPYDSPFERQDQEPFPSTPSTPSPPRSSVLDSARECVHAPDLRERRSEAICASRRSSSLGTPDPEDAGAVASRRHPGPGFRSGCSACRHPRVSGPSIPPSPQMTFFEQRMPFSDTTINTCVASSRHRVNSSVQHKMVKKTKRERHISLQPIAHNDENEPPLPKPMRPMSVLQATGISSPRQRTHSPRTSNAILSREPFSPAQRRLEPNHLLNRLREGDKHTSSHHLASVDLRLPISGANPLLHSLDHTSPIDIHPHTPIPTRVQNFSYSRMHSHGHGNVAARVSQQSSNQDMMVSRVGTRLPSWISSHHARHRDSTAMITTTSSVNVKPPAPGSMSPPPAKTKASIYNLLPIQPTRSRFTSVSIVPKVANDMGTKRCDHRSVPSTRTHKHTRNNGALPSSFFHLRMADFKRKW